MDRPWARGSLPLGAASVALLVCAVQPAAAASTDAQSDQEIVVNGEKAPVQAPSGTKSATPLVETPQTVSVADGSFLSNLGLRNLNQALRFVAGVTPETRDASAEVYDQFKFRGFDAPIYLDGLKLLDSASGYAAPQIDVSRIDRIEIVKGPASVLYGQSGPGGLVVESSKPPLDRGSHGSIAGTYGNRRTGQGTIGYSW